MKKVGNHFCAMDREGKDINIFELSKESKFKAVGTMKVSNIFLK